VGRPLRPRAAGRGRGGRVRRLHAAGAPPPCREPVREPIRTRRPGRAAVTVPSRCTACPATHVPT